ncbi:MAG: SAM-dependent methyltransferase [Chitinophagales bacterium]
MIDFLSGEYWNNRYRDASTGWDLGEVSPPLKAYIDHLTNKNLKILIPGGGNSYEADYLVQKGFTDITVIDIAETPVEKLKLQFGGNHSIRILQDDFFTHTDTYDLILEQTFFCALDPSLRDQYATHMHELLNKDGILAGVLFKTVFDNPGPPFGGTPEEYRGLFEKYFDLKIFADCYNSVAPRLGNEIFITLIRK